MQLKPYDYSNLDVTEDCNAVNGAPDIHASKNYTVCHRYGEKIEIHNNSRYM